MDCNNAGRGICGVGKGWEEVMPTKEILINKDNYVIGIDLAKDECCSAVSVLCGNCKTIIFSKSFKEDAVKYPIFCKCPNCGVRYATVWEELDDKLKRIQR